QMLGRRGRLVLAVRLGAVAWLLVALLEPLAVHSSTRTWQREVAVIIDDSDSMQVVDEHADPGYALEVAALFGQEIARGRPRLDQLAEALRMVAVSLERGANGFFEEEVLGLAEERLRDIPAELDEFDPGLRDRVIAQINAIDQAQRGGDAAAIERGEALLNAALGEAMVALSLAQEEAEQAFVADLGDDRRGEIEEAGRHSRAEIARRAVAKIEGDDGRDLIEALRHDYKVHFYFAGSDLVPADSNSWFAADTQDDFRDHTNLGGALDAVLRGIPPKLLAGAVVVSDGANNSGVDIDGPTRGFALRGAPIAGITLGGGSRAGAIDAAVTGVHAPRRLVLGKPLRIDVDLNFQNMQGRRATVVLREDGIEVDRKPFQVRDPYQRPSLGFEHIPERDGVREYQVEVEPDGPEQIVANNQEMVRVQVIEEDRVDALDVLLVDSFPRWEFRYLRNLFDGRDQSVRLQHVLFRPEAIKGVAPLPAVAASTARPFGESRASELPATPAEWSAFEVIIIGDVAPQHLTAEQWATIEECVDTGGALLVLVAGKKWMPHLIDDQNFVGLAPAIYEPGLATPPPSQMLPYRVRWTPAGMDSQLDRLSSDPAETRSIWDAIPPIRWRHPVGEIKAGAELLAYATPVHGDLGAADGDLDSYAERNALIVTQRYGKGRVVAMNFDRTYRMRFGFGERLHHRFWWQLIHWKATEEFALDSLVEIKLDREEYEFGLPVQVVAKAIDTADEALPGPLSVKVVDTSNGKEVLRQTLLPRMEVHGVFEAELSDLAADRSYEAVLEGDGVADLLAEPGERSSQSVSAKFAVRPAKPVELRDLAPHPEVLGRLASRTGGRVAPLGDAPSLADLFGEPQLSETTRTENFLWDRPLFLIIFTILLAAEWILRRQAGLP
ncbi:MAG: hypothetical protein ACR2RV_22695, partial [Verrucomicrobiales bacterium]